MKRLISGPWHGLRMFALITGITVFFLSAAVLIVGWGFGVAALRGPLPDFSTMKTNTALGVGALGLSLGVSQLRGPIGWLRLILAAMAAAFGAITLAEYSFGWDAGVDQLLFLDPATAAAAFPGRPAPLTACLLLLLGVATMGPEGRRCLAVLPMNRRLSLEREIAPMTTIELWSSGGLPSSRATPVSGRWRCARSRRMERMRESPG